MLFPGIQCAGYKKMPRAGLAAPGEVLKASERRVERTPDGIICFRTGFLCLMAHIVGRLARSKPLIVGAMAHRQCIQFGPS